VTTRAVAEPPAPPAGAAAIQVAEVIRSTRQPAAIMLARTESGSGPSTSASDTSSSVSRMTPTSRAGSVSGNRGSG
jgi:hypothetical protein